jgi:hypothetical protein
VGGKGGPVVGESGRERPKWALLQFSLVKLQYLTRAWSGTWGWDRIAQRWSRESSPDANERTNG